MAGGQSAASTGSTALIIPIETVWGVVLLPLRFHHFFFFFFFFLPPPPPLFFLGGFNTSGEWDLLNYEPEEASETEVKLWSCVSLVSIWTASRSDPFCYTSSQTDWEKKPPNVMPPPHRPKKKIKGTKQNGQRNNNWMRLNNISTKKEENRVTWLVLD